MTGLIEQDLDEFNKFVQTYPMPGTICRWRTTFVSGVLRRS